MIDINYKKLVETAILAGEIMLRSGAEIYRVEDTIERILKISELTITKGFVTSTGIIVTIVDNEDNAITMAGKVNERNTNLNHIYLANNISRSLCKGELTIEEAYQELLLIEKKKEYSDKLLYLCIIITTTFFTVRIGGNIYECLLSALNGGIIVVCIMLSEKIKLNGLVNILVTSLLLAFTTIVINILSKGNINLERIISSSIMPMVPGVAITNAVRDTLQGDCVSGGARIIEAFALVTVIAVGIGTGFLLSSYLFGGDFI